MEIGHADEKFRAQGHPTEWSLTGLRRDRRSDRGKFIIKMIQDSFQIVREMYTAASLVESGRKREDSGDEITINCSIESACMGIRCFKMFLRKIGNKEN